MKPSDASTAASGAAGKGAGLFGRLKLWQKFALIGVLVVPTVALPTTQYVLHVLDIAGQQQAEAAGLPAVSAVAELVEDVQVHRGLTAGILGGNEGFAKERADRENQVTQGMAKVDEFVRATLPRADTETGKHLTETWAKVKANFPRIVQGLAGRSLTAPESFRLHTAMVTDLHALNDAFMDHHKLHLDPNAHTYHLIQASLVKLPEFTEELGQLRALGTNALLTSRGQAEGTGKGKNRTEGGGISDATRGRIAALVAAGHKTHEETDHALGKSFIAKPALEKGALGAAEKAADKISKDTLQLITRELLEKSRPDYSPDEFFKQLTATIESNLAFQKAAITVTKQELDDAVRATRNELLFEGALTIALIVIAAFVGVLSARSVLQPVAQLQSTMQKLREGDTTARARLTSTDEIGHLANEFDSMVDQREAVAAKISRDNELLNDSIIDILRAVAKTAQGDLTVQAPVREDVTGALSDAINSMADSTAKTLAKVTVAASEVRTASQDGRETVHQTSRGMNDIRGTIQETAKRIKRLGERSQEITGIVKLIDDIAERTSVLALNANMQAAMAGEAGRGFRVVADEVQRLAERSKEATDQIGKLVGTIQAETNDTMATMDRAIGEVVKGGELADKAAEKVTELDALGGELLESVQAFRLPEEVVRDANATAGKGKVAHDSRRAAA